MKKTNISKFIAVGLCICALTGCGASPDEKPDTSNPIVNSNTNEENANGSSENKGNDILESANLIGSVLEFTDNGCSVSVTENLKVVLQIQDIGMLFLLGGAVILVALCCSILPILRANPKDILAKMEG